MIEVRSFDSLGGANHGWLDAKHHFSFANYRDPKRVHWGTLRVWNDDAIAPHTGDEHNTINQPLLIRSNARGASATIKAGQSITYTFDDDNRYGYLVPAVGQIKVNETLVNEQDGAAIYLW